MKNRDIRVEYLIDIDIHVYTERILYILIMYKTLYTLYTLNYVQNSQFYLYIYLLISISFSFFLH